MFSKSIKPQILIVAFLLFTLAEHVAIAQQASDSGIASKVDLARHDFLYAGEAKVQDMYIVKDGKVTWEHKGPRVEKYLGEISDAVMMTNGNILFAHQYGITLINQKDEVLWSHKAPENTEIHSVQPIGKKHIIYVQNGNPAKVIVRNISTDEIVQSFTVPVKNPDGTHGHFRHARLTKAGTYMLAHMDLGKVAEYDFEGNEVWSMEVPGIWSAEPLANGNVLLCGSDRWIREVNKAKEVVWDFKLDEHPHYKITSPQIATRLDNGNTIINNWFSDWDDKLDLKNPPIQAIEVTPAKEVVWVLQSWEDPNLGPSTTIQVLGDKRISEHVRFGKIK